MAYWTRMLSLPARKYVGPTSRYASSRMMQYTEEKKLTFETYKRQKKTVSGNVEWLEITKNVEYRPDLVSEEIYGTPDLWWSIMEINGMKDILEFKEGVKIKLSGNIMA